MNPTFRTPMWTDIATGVLAALPLIVIQQLPVIVVGATGLIYLSYFLTNVVVLQARQWGWPARPAWFNLSRWAMPINILALVYGGSMLINFAWFRKRTNPTIGAAFTGIANWFIIGGTPIVELLVAVLLIVGALYWFAVQRHKVVQQQVAPTAEAGGEAGMRPAR